MSSIRNKVQLIGNLGQNPEVKILENGNKLVKASLATNETYYDKEGNKQTTTDWHNIVAWGNIANIIEKYVFQGSEIAIEGKLQTRSYETKEGEKRYITEVKVNDIVLLGGKTETTLEPVQVNSKNPNTEA